MRNTDAHTSFFKQVEYFVSDIISMVINVFLSAAIFVVPVIIVLVFLKIMSTII